MLLSTDYCHEDQSNNNGKLLQLRVTKRELWGQTIVRQIIMEIVMTVIICQEIQQEMTESKLSKLYHV